jgi:hypothetical protein
MLGDAEGAAARRHAQDMLKADRQTGSAAEGAGSASGGSGKHRGNEGAAGRREGKRK